MFRCSDIREENEKKAREYAGKIVDILADGDYSKINSVIDDFGNGWSGENLSLLSEFIEGYKEYNETEIFHYDTAEIPDITYKDGSKYQREYFYYNEEDFSFSYECDLLPTDLTLMLDFNYIDGMYKVIFYDVHQL